jgi:hypothetical protein
MYITYIHTYIYRRKRRREAMMTRGSGLMMMIHPGK